MKTSFLLLALLLWVPGEVGAQNALEEVETLMGQGRILQARETLQGWLEGEGRSAGRMDRQRGIWLRGLLTVDPSMAEMDFRRLAVEFPGGPFTDDALLRLGQAAEFRGDLRQAHANFTQLAREYPNSPLRDEARAWVQANAAALEALGPAAAVPSEPSLPPPAGNARAPGTSTSTSPILHTEGMRGSDEPRGAFSVQVGAFRKMEGARSLAQRLVDAGFQPRLVRTPGSDLVRARVGMFTGRDEAVRLQRQVREAGFEAAIVSDANAEEEVG